MGSQCCKCAKENKDQKVKGFYKNSGKFGYRGDQPIPSRRYNVQTRGKIVQLTLKQLQKDDTGHYALVAKKLVANNYSLSRNSNRDLVTQKIRMNVHESLDNLEEGEPPVFIRRLTDLSVKVGTRTRFLVEIRSSSSLKVTWHRNDLPVHSGSRFSFVHEGNFYCVDVAPVMVEDQGYWTCMVENINGRSSCTSYLSVIVPNAYKSPEFVEQLRALLTETGTVSLECKAVGVPTPVLRWFKDEKEIKAGDVFALTANADDPTSLGTYACQAVNCMGTACSSSRVHVMGRGSREGSLKPADSLLPAGPVPVFRTILKDESCKIGDNLTLSCQVQVPPWPKAITWYNKEGRVESDEKYHIREDGLGTYSIDVNGVEAMDEGEWKCVATSAENVMQFTTCFVAMSIPKNYRMPRFMESLKAVLTDEGLVSFECKVVGFPTPLLRWFKDDQELKPGDVYQLTGTNSLGSYCCIAKNCMGESKSTAELTIEDIQNQLNEEERLQLMSENKAPKFIKGLRSCEARIHEDFTFTIQVSILPASTLSWYRDDEPIVENNKYKLIKEVLGTYHLEVHKLEFIDQAEWKCVAANDFGHSITSCFLKLIIPKHFKKPKFLENLRAILSEEGTVNLECKVIGVPQPILKWYKDGAELKPGDIHRITSGQDGTCYLGIYTCKATNCMGSVSSSASLLGFDDRVAIQNEEPKESMSPLPHELARNLSLSTIHEERTSQLYDAPQTDHSITIDDRGEVSFSFDGKEVSVSLYETPDLTEEEAIQIVEMYADQLSEHITEGNVIELPPMRFMKETSTTGNLLMEAVVIDISPDYFAGEDEADDLRTEADFEDVSILDDQIQSILSSYSAPADEQSGEITPMGSPPPRPPRKKERSSSTSLKSEKSDRSQPKIYDWSESYHSAKEPSMQVELSFQSQDSVDAFADALSSEGLVKSLSKENAVKVIYKVEQMDAEDDIQYELENIPVASLQSAKLTEEVYAAAEKQSMDIASPEKRKRKKKHSKSKGETLMLSSKTSSEESYTMSADGYEPDEKIQKRESKEYKDKLERRDSSSSNKSNKSARNEKKKKKKGSHELKQSLRIEKIKLEKVTPIEVPQVTSQANELYIEEGDRLLDEVSESPSSSVFTTAGDISDNSMSKSQKERFIEIIRTLSNPVSVLRSTLIDLDNISAAYSQNKVDDETIQKLILERIVRPIKNLCEQMSVIEEKSVNTTGNRSLTQNTRISLLDTIGRPTEELLRGIELMRNHKNKTPEDFKSDLIMLESLTDPVDEIFINLARIEHGLIHKGKILRSIECAKHPIKLERMAQSILRLNKNVSKIKLEMQSSNADPKLLAFGERLECVYQNLHSFVASVSLDKITGAIDSNVDTLVIETLIKPFEKFVRVLDNVSLSSITNNNRNAIDDLQKAVINIRIKLETLTIALETYEAESGKFGITQKNLELVNYLKWITDDLYDNIQKSKKIYKTKSDDNVPESIPASSVDEWKLDNACLPVQPSTNDIIKIQEFREQIIEENRKVRAEIIDIVTVNNEVEENPWGTHKFNKLVESHTKKEHEPEGIISKNSIPKSKLDSESIDASSKRLACKSLVSSLDSATAELDETLPLSEMILDPLIDVQAKLNSALHHYENKNFTDASSCAATKLSVCLSELHDSITSTAHVTTTLNVSDILNRIIDLREPLLNFQLALSSTPTYEEICLLEEVVRPLNKLKDLVSATIRSSFVSESSKIILGQVVHIIEDIQERFFYVSHRKISVEEPIEPIIKMMTVKPPEKLDQASLNLSGVHFILSTALAVATESSIHEPSDGVSSSDKSSVSAQRLMTAIETLRDYVGEMAVYIASPVVPEGATSEYIYELVTLKLAKLEEPLLNLQKILLTEEHQPEERHILNNISNPLHALREIILEINESQSSTVLELLEDIEKDVSLIAMEALKKSMEKKIVEEVSSVYENTPGEVPQIVSKWMDPIENWLASASVEVDEKGRNKSVLTPIVNNLKRQLLKIAIQSSYSEPPSDISLIEQLAGLKEPLSKVCEVIATNHDPVDLKVIENLVQPTKHLLGTVLDTSVIHSASSVLGPVIEALEELDNQIPLSIKTITYHKLLKGVVRSLTPEKLESVGDISDLEKFSGVELNEFAISSEDGNERINDVTLNIASFSQTLIDVHGTCSTNLSNIFERKESITGDEEKNSVLEFTQKVKDNVADAVNTSNLLSGEDVDSEEKLNAMINIDYESLYAKEDHLKCEESQIPLASARIEELDLWSLTILGPLERLANTTLSLDRSIDEDVHSYLCRPLDSLHEQIELVESQINRPAGQSLENDVETIIEGFLSPVNQVATALKIAVEIWRKTPLKETVKCHLQDLSESCSDLSECLEALKQKLITEAPAQSLQVQKSEASVIETISAVLGPLEGIKEVILEILQDDVEGSEKEMDNSKTIISHPQKIDESKSIIFDAGKDYQKNNIIDSQSASGTHNLGLKNEIESIEKVTAQPLQELIEAIVDPNSVQCTSTPEEIENDKISLKTEKLKEKTLNDDSKMAEHGTTDIITPSISQISYRVTLADENIAKDEAKIIDEEISNDTSAITNVEQSRQNDVMEVQQSLIFKDTISNVMKVELQGHDEDQHIEVDTLTKATLLQIEQTLDKTTSQSEKYSANKAIVDLIKEEFRKQNVELPSNENFISIIAKRIYKAIFVHPMVSHEDIFQEIIRDMIQVVRKQGMCVIKSETIMKDIESKLEIIFEKIATALDVPKTKVDGQNNHEASTIVGGLDEIIAIDNQTILEESILIDTSIYLSRIRDITKSELNRQSLLSFENESLIKNVETSVQEIMAKCPQICQENVFEESVRDIVLEELQKIQNSHRMRIFDITTKETVKDSRYPQITSATAGKFSEQIIRDLVLDELQKHNIQAFDEQQFIQRVKSKIQNKIESCPDIVHENTLQEILHAIIMEEIKKNTEDVDSHNKVEEPNETKTDSPIKEISGLHIFEETIKNIIVDELQQYHIFTLGNDDYTKLIIRKIQEITSICLEQVQGENIEERVRYIVKEELHKTKDVFDVENAVANGENSSIDAVEMNNSIPTLCTKPPSREFISSMVREEIKKQNIQLVDQPAIIEMILMKIQDIIASSSQIVKNNTSGGIIQKTVSEVIQQISKIRSSDDPLNVTDLIIPLINTSFDELRTTISKGYTIKVYQKENGEKDVLEKVTETTLQNARMSPGIIQEEKTDVHIDESLKVQHITTLTASAIAKTEKHLVSDHQEHESIIRVIPFQTAQLHQEKISEQCIRELLNDEIIKQSAESFMNDKLSDVIVSQIQQTLINSPGVHVERSLEDVLQEMIIGKLEEQKGRFIQAEDLDDTKEVRTVALVAAAVSNVETTGGIHEIIIEEMHKQNIELEQEENFIRNIISQVEEFITEAPKVFTKNALKQKVREIIMKTQINKNKKSLENTIEITQEIIQKLIVEKLHKCNGSPSLESSVTLAVESKFRDIGFQIPVISNLDIIEKNVEDIVVEVLEGNKAKVLENREPSKTDEIDMKNENLSIPSITHSRASPEEIVYELIVDKLHKQNIDFEEEGNIMKAIQADIQMLIIQHPEVTKIDALEESIQDIVSRALLQEKAKLRTSNKLDIVKTEKMLIQHCATSSVAQTEDLTTKIDESHMRNTESTQESDLSQIIKDESQEVFLRDPENFELISKTYIKEPITNTIHEESAIVIERAQHWMRNRGKLGEAKIDPFTPDQEQLPPAEVIHLLIVEELHRQNIQSTDRHDLIKIVEMKMQEMIIHQPKLSNLNILEQKIHDVIKEMLYREELTDTKSKITFGNKVEVAQNINEPLSAQIVAQSEEFIRPLIVSELYKQNVKPSEAANILQAIEIQVKPLINLNLIECPEDLSQKVHGIVLEILSKQEAQVCGVENNAGEKNAKFLPSMETKRVIEELIPSLIAEKLCNLDVQQNEISNIAKSIETKIKNLIQINPKLCEAKFLNEKVQDMVAKILRDQKTPFVDNEKFREDQEETGKMGVPEILSPAHKNSDGKELINSLFADRAVEENLQALENTHIDEPVKEEIENLISVNPNIYMEVSTVKIEDIIPSVIEKQESQIYIVEELSQITKKKIQIENIPTLSLVEAHEIFEEVVHDLIIQEIRQQNVKEIEETNFVKAIAKKLQILIAACPKISFEDMIEEKVHDIVIEIVKKQKATAVTIEEHKYAEEQKMTIKEMQCVVETQEIQIPDHVQKILDNEFNTRKIGPSTKSNVFQAVNTKVLELIQKSDRISKLVITKEHIQDLITRELSEAEKTDVKIQSRKTSAQQMVGKEAKQYQLPMEYLTEKIISDDTVKKVNAFEVEHSESLSKVKILQPIQLEQQAKAELQMSKEIIDGLINIEISKHNFPENADFEREIREKVETFIHQITEIPDKIFLEHQIREIIEFALTRLGTTEDRNRLAEKIEQTKQQTENYKISVPSYLKIPEESAHELVIDKFCEQNIFQISEEDNFAQAVQIKVRDWIQQHPKDSYEHIIEESIREIISENLDKQKAEIVEEEQLLRACQRKFKLEVRNLSISNEIQILDEVVHDMIIDEFHKQKIEPLAKKNLMKAVEAKIHNLIANHPEMCEDDIFEDSIHDIVFEMQAEQSANIIETESFAKAKKDSVKVKVSPSVKKTVGTISEKIDREEFQRANLVNVSLISIEDKKHEILEPKSQNKSEKHSRTSKMKEEDEVKQQSRTISKSKDLKIIVSSEQIKEYSKNKQGELENVMALQLIEDSLVDLKQKNNTQDKQRRNIQIEVKVEDPFGKKLQEQRSLKFQNISSTPRTTEILAANTNSEFNFEYSEYSKSTLKDVPHLEKQNRNSLPTIEIDSSIILDKEVSSHRSMTLTKRFQDQQSFDFEDRSLDIYSSSTSRIRSSSHGPCDRGKKPTFCTKLTDRTATEASRIKLTCTVLGDPEPEVYFMKDGQQLPLSTNRHCTIIENGLVSLELYAVEPKDSGEYSCIATNIHGHACTEAKLKVYAGYKPTPSIPIFTRSIKDTYRANENTLVLECRVRGQPLPTITWLKDGQILEVSNRYQQSDLADGICQLKIFHPDFYDSGLYTCRAENNTKLSDRTSYLVNFDTTEKQRYVPSWRSSNSCFNFTSTHEDTGRPRFSSHLTDYNVPAGGTIALQVEVKGIPTPEITWMRTSKKGPTSVPKARTFADSDTTESETGAYVCRASNAYGHVDTSANVEVVSGSAHDGGRPAMFVSRPPDKHIIIALGEDVSVSFRTTGVPKPRVTWMKGLRDITNGPRSYKEGHDDYVRLTLKRACLTDEGTYCILTKNCYGCDRSFFTVQVKQRARSLTPSPDWGAIDIDNLLANIHDKERSYLKQVPGPISSEPVVVDGGRNWLALAWGKAEQRGPAPVVAYRVDAWLLGREGSARWTELGVTPINAYDAFNLRPGEEYKFRITPRNRYGWGEPVTMTNSVTVREIVKFPEFIKILSGQLKALAGTILNLEAEVTSDSMAQVKWYRNTTEIVNGQDSRFTTYFNGSKCSLMIGNISENDSGRYVCEATNAAGRVSTFARVQVVENVKIVEADKKLRQMRSSETMNEDRPPEFTMRLRDRRVQVTYPVRLTCQVTGYPEPEVTWYKYREEIYSHDNVAIWNDEAHFHTLEISRSTIDDSGIYMARATNIYGSVTCRCHLVVDKGIRAYIAPEFLRHLDSVYTVKTSEELRMTAQVEAYPSVGITWHHDGHRLRPGRNVIMTLNHDGTVKLELAHVTERDAGLYCCSANNEVGQAESTTRVIVMEVNDSCYSNQSVPKITESLDIPYSKVPLFITKPLSTKAFEGDTVIIFCEVVGDPKPEVIWLRDFLRPDYYKDAPHFRRIGAGPQYRLEIPYAKFDFTGTYSIIAKNCHGEAKAVISLQIYARGQGKEDSGMESTIKHGNVQTLPMIKRPLRDLRCCDGDAITFVCKIRATPEPDVRWEKGGKLVPLGDDFTMDFDGEIARLSIQHVYPEDEGEYTCIAYNDLGKAYTSACLIVDVPEGKETALSRRLTKPQGFLSADSTPISTPRSTPMRSLSPSCKSKRELKSMSKIARGTTGARRPRLPTGPKFYAVPHNCVAEEGETVRFQCAIAGHPIPWVTWDKNGISVTPTARILLKENDDVRMLEITEITLDDAGLYRITLENDIGKTEATARLEIIRGQNNSVSRSIRTRSTSPRTHFIYGRSHLSTSPRPSAHLQPPRLIDAHLNRGGTISPTYPRWHYRNGEQTVQTDTKLMNNGTATFTALSKVIRSSSIPRQTTFGKNPNSNYGTESSMRFKKNSKTQPMEYLSSSHQSSTIPKRVEINPKSKLLKKRLSTLILPTNAFDKSASSMTKTTTMKTVKTAVSKIIPSNLSAKEEEYLSMNPKSPIILAAPADVIALRGAKVTLLTTYDSGYPKPTVKWLQKGHDITLDDKTEIETSAGLTCLTLMNITTNESGKYEVRIKNKVGSDSRYVNVTVEGPPEPPADKPTIHSITPSGSVTLTWRTPVYDGGCAVTGYTVEMRRGDESCWVAVAEARHSLTHTVQQLDTMESYRFRVRAENVHGLSEPGMESDVITISNKATTDEMSENVFGIKANNGTESEDEFEPAFEPRIVISEPGHLFEERYDVLEELGKGRYGIVRRIVDKNSKLNLAAKFVRTIKFKDRQQVHDEINIMNILRHPKLLRLAAAFENPKEMILITEYISGGELFERVVADDFTLTEKDSILFMRQICQGVEYMHNNKVVHLDLKPENIMCHTRTSHRIKLIDFGLAQTLKPDTPVRVLFGTPEFIPPEIIGFEPIGTESDMWSVGVICYVLLSGLSPFMGDNDAETFANITRAECDFDDKAFHAISQEAQNFISSLLIKRKEYRMSATDCLKHPWLAQRDESMSCVALPTEKLKKFIVRRKWQKTGNAIRALGRMATLSANSRRNISSSPPLSKLFNEDIETEYPEIHEESLEKNPESLVYPTPENSPDELKNIPYINECTNNTIEIEEIHDETEASQTLTDVSLDEELEENSDGLANADSLTIVEVKRSKSFNDCTILEDNEYSLKLDENNSENEHIEDETNIPDFTAEIHNASDETSSENETMFTAIDSSLNENIITVDINPKHHHEFIKDQEDDTSKFYTFKNLQVTEPTIESSKYVIEELDIEEMKKEKATLCVEEKEQSSSTTDNVMTPNRPSFIAIKSYSNPIDCIPWSKTNPSSLGTESEDTWLKKNSPLHRIVRTGSVSRTAKMFEQEDSSSPTKQPTGPRGRIVIPAPEARPQNERIRKAFAFWNK